MPQIASNRRKPAAAAVTLFALAALLLSACGGSSSTSSSATTAKAASGARGQFGARGAALRTCLQKNGVTLPKRPAGQHGAPGAGRAAGPLGNSGRASGPQLPKGVTRAQLQAAFKKCGGGQFTAGGGRFNSAAGRQRFAKFAACMKADGVTLPAPNTTGKGPIFNTKGIDTNSVKFKAAEAKCAAGLRPNGGGTGAAGSPGGSSSTGESGGLAGATPPAGGPGAAPPAE